MISNAITTTLRSRLQGSRIYFAATTGTPTLYINVNAVGLAYSIRLELQRLVLEPVHENFGGAKTWQTGSTGTHGQNQGFIFQYIGQYTGRFIDEYLAVNKSACE